MRETLRDARPARPHAALPPLLLTVPEASRILGIGRSRLYELLATGEIPSLRIGRLRRIPYAALQGWVARQSAAPPPAAPAAAQQEPAQGGGASERVPNVVDNPKKRKERT
jgi:excisionase family DNA binding protein